MFLKWIKSFFVKPKYRHITTLSCRFVYTDINQKYSAFFHLSENVNDSSDRICKSYCACSVENPKNHTIYMRYVILWLDGHYTNEYMIDLSKDLQKQLKELDNRERQSEPDESERQDPKKFYH